MPDIFSVEKRSDIMSRVKSKDTQPELLVRKALFTRGFRYRVHDKKLPGMPDIVLKKYNAIIFIHGCFWHGHMGCSRSRLPSSRKEFWSEKIKKNIERDTKTLKSLSEMGYRILIIWECSLKGKNKIPFTQLMDEIEGWLYEGPQLLEIQGRDET